MLHCVRPLSGGVIDAAGEAKAPAARPRAAGSLHGPLGKWRRGGGRM